VIAGDLFEPREVAAMQRGTPDVDLLTVPEAAAVLKVSPVTVSRWLRQGRLPAYRLGPRAVRIRRADLQAVFAPARPPAEATAAGAPSPPDPVAPDGPTNDALVALADQAVASWDAAAVAIRLEALAAAAGLREQILARRKGSILAALDGDRKRGKRS
jgi:excisionase family DNA binding protein